MPVPQYNTDALPDVDPPPSAEALAGAHALIQADLSSARATTLHPGVPPERVGQFSAGVAAELARLEAGASKPRGTGIDLSRYEALDAPPADSDAATWRATLQQASASAEYLHGREANLGLLETYGRNAWLIGNSRLEDELRSVERDVEAAKQDLQAVAEARRAAQGGAAGELKGLEESWRTGVGRMIEAQAAGERLKQEILARMRHAAL